MVMDTATMDTAAPENAKIIPREMPDVAEARKQLCASIRAEVEADKKRWEPVFKGMREDMRFASGKQWPNQGDGDDRYVANIVLRHIQQRVAAIYGKNPKTVARRRERLLSTVWDGTHQSLVEAQEAMVMDPMDMAAMQVIADAQKVKVENMMMDRIARSLEKLYEHNVTEQAIDFKTMMKATVRRAITAGVGYVKLTFQRAMKMRPEIEARIADYSERLATVERLSADLADEQHEPDSAETEQLRLAIQALAQEEQILVREGLVFDYPDSTKIIPDRQCRQLRGFLGCDRVTQEYDLTADKIKEIYKVDVTAGGARAYTTGHGDVAREAMSIMTKEDQGPTHLFRVWETYSRPDGLVYVTCDGYPDFLQEPAAPDTWTDRFWPWYPLTFNDVYSEECIYPPSDVSLIRDMQLEVNRARQGLREHRQANRPKTAVSAGKLSDEDKEKLQSHPANAVIELEGLQPGEKVEDVLQPWRNPPIDPALYDTGPAFEDILRTVGVQEANLGGTSGSTATETSIAESSRMSSLSSNVDDMDEMLTEMARVAGQILLDQVQKETVIKVVGPGAVWPEFDRDTIVREIYLEVEAASTGRPNKAAEVQNATQIMPLLMQIPGISPEWIGRELIRRMDDRLDLTDAFAAGVPSIQAMNAAMAKMGGMGGAAPGIGADPSAQGIQGGMNAPGTEPPQTTVGPRAQSADQPNPMMG
jgi:hypothetical protein